jgi:very-short-patch-repair endonuclease
MHDVERAIGAIAARQDDVITREQLLDAGLGRGALEHRVRSGQIRRLFPGVYLFGYAPPSARQLILAAVLSRGNGAVASYSSAAYLWGMVRQAGAEVHVTVTRRGVRCPPGIALHRVAELDPCDVTQADGISVTTPARTLLDMAATSPPADVGDAMTEAFVHRLVSAAQIKAQIDRVGPGRRGRARLLELVEPERAHGYTRSRAERRLRRLLKPSGLPMPRFNVWVNGHRVDAVWARERLIIEVDGYDTHGNRASFESDRRRDQDHVAAGYRVIRITWRQLVREAERVLVRIAQALAAGPT